MVTRWFEDRLSFPSRWRRGGVCDGSRRLRPDELSQSPTSDYSPAWSPDGTTIAFASDRDSDPNEIYLMDADGSNPIRVTDNPGIDEYPTWSPDGIRIVIHCTMGGIDANGTGDFEICVVNRDGTGLHRLTDTPGKTPSPIGHPTASRSPSSPTGSVGDR